MISQKVLFLGFMKRCFWHDFTLTLAAAAAISIAGCAPSKREVPLIDPKPPRTLSSAESKQLLNEVGKNWIFGQGVGETVATVGTIAVFPPFALVVIGNTALGLAGYDTVKMRDFLPEEAADVYEGGYDLLTSAPGRTFAAVGEEEFRDREVSKIHLDKIVNGGSTTGSGVAKAKGNLMLLKEEN